MHDLKSQAINIKSRISSYRTEIGDNLADVSGASGKRVCPVCDEEVPADAKQCPSCSTDLTLFTPEQAAALPSDAEALKSSILSEESEHISDMLKVAEGDVGAPVEGEFFECGACNAMVPSDATKCPKCGAEFTVEEVFECPMCKKLIDVTVNKCPSCGTEFVEEEPAAPALPSSAPPKEKPKAQPEVAKPAAQPSQPKPPEKPASFADRMRQMKEAPPDQKPAQQSPAAAPEKPMSFAERMKAMKEGGAAQQPARPPTPAPMPATGIIRPSAQPTTQRHGVPTKEEEFKELPRLIGDVRKLLVVAKDCGIDITKSKMLISRAITSSKNKELEAAVKLVKEGKLGLVNDLRTYTMAKHRSLTNTLSLARKGGKDITSAERILDNTKKCVEADDYLTALSELKRAEEMAEGLSGGSVLSQVEIDAVARIIEDAMLLNVNVSEAKNLYDQAKNASETGDTARVSVLSKEINDSLMKVLPRYIANEMRKAKADLRDIKLMNMDITHPVDILKRANDSVRDGDYGTALHAMKEFKDFLGKLQKSA